MRPREQRTSSTLLRLETLEDRRNPSTAYLATDLIADRPGVAALTDPTLVNAWGISLSQAGGAFWVSANGTGLSQVYGGDVNGSPLTQPFKVTTPGGATTGQVFAGLAGNFLVTGVTAAGAPITAPSAFIFASESGAITGWAAGVFTGPGQPGPSRNAFVGYQAADGAVYKGLALANNGAGNFLYAADFRNGKIDVLNAQFQKVALAGAFVDPTLPAGYAPFNVAVIGGKLYVSYAKQDSARQDDVAGRGNGYVSVFDLNGHFERRLISRGSLNSPWGMVQAPAGFGDFGGALLVGNFGNGKIHAYDPTTGAELGALRDNTGQAVVIDGLWGLAFGNGRSAGDANSLYYAAGPANETQGLFGKITANAAGTNPVTARLAGGELVITGSRNDDRVNVDLTRAGRVVVTAGGQVIGDFDAAAVGTVRFTGYAGDDWFTVDRDVTAAVFADGGAGNDVLIGGNGNNILVGNTGDDIIYAGASRDVLIGGVGYDFLFGTGNDDILIGGTTAHDNSPAALFQILGVWTSTASYNDRTAAISAGTGGVPKLDATTVTDDGVRDHLFGGSGLDWFFTYGTDRIFGKKPSERVS